MNEINYKKKEKQLKIGVIGLLAALWVAVALYSVTTGFQPFQFISRLLSATLIAIALIGGYYILSALRFNNTLKKYWKCAENKAALPEIIKELESTIGTARVQAQYKDAMIRHLLSNFYALDKAYDQSAHHCREILALDKPLEEIKLLAIHRQFNNLYLQQSNKEALNYFNRYKNYIHRAGRYKNLAPLFKLDLVLISILLKKRAGAQQVLSDFKKTYPDYSKDIIVYYEKEIQGNTTKQ